MPVSLCIFDPPLVSSARTVAKKLVQNGQLIRPTGLRLFLPKDWTSDPARLKRAGVSIEYQVARTKPEIALAEVDRAISAGVRFGCVLADSDYGMSAPFRQGLTARKLAWAVGIPRHLKVYPVGGRLIERRAKVRGRRHKRQYSIEAG
jgi:SRSO17 transposase